MKTPQAINQVKTRCTRAGWDRRAPYYDFMTLMMDSRLARPWLALQWKEVEGLRVLEVGVGTGRSFEHYPKGLEVIAIDLSGRMLRKARAKAVKSNVKVQLLQMDAQQLAFRDNSFDSVVATFTFCSVFDPVLGLEEIRRVTRPGGKVILLEHMRHDNLVIGKMMDLANPLTVWLMGPNINRRTLDNIKKAGLKIEKAVSLGMGGIFKLIVASPNKEG